MKKLTPVFLAFMAIFLTSCEAIGDIFEAGFNVGIFVAVAVVVLILWFLLRGRK